MEQRVRSLAATYGLLDLSRCVTVAAVSRSESEALEGYVLRLHATSQYEWVEGHLRVAGCEEWLHVAAYSEVLATIAEWVRRRPSYCRFIPSAEVLGRAGQEKSPRSAPAVSEAERKRGVWVRRRAREVARHGGNRANLEASQQAIEEHTAYLRRVQLWKNSLHHRVEGRLLFVCGRRGEIHQPPEAPGNLLLAGLAAQLAAHRAIALPPKASWTRTHILTRSRRILVLRAGDRHGLMVRVRIDLCALEADFVRHTPELGVWVRWLVALRDRARVQRLAASTLERASLAT